MRSIEKYLSGWEDLYLVGDKVPDWFRGNVIYYAEESQKLPRNILYKIQASFPQGGPKVLQWQDDFYLTRPIDVTDIKYWFEKDLKYQISRHHGTYKKMIENTARYTTERALYYDIHAPIIYEQSWFNELVNTYPWDKLNLCIKSLYCDLTRTRNHEEMKNCKINGPVSDVGKVVGDSLFFSTGPFGVCPAVEEYLQSKYPEPSRFE